MFFSFGFNVKLREMHYEDTVQITPRYSFQTDDFNKITYDMNNGELVKKDDKLITAITGEEYLLNEKGAYFILNSNTDEKISLDGAKAKIKKIILSQSNTINAIEELGIIVMLKDYIFKMYHKK